jgi:hypothetical protein
MWVNIYLKHFQAMLYPHCFFNSALQCGKVQANHHVGLELNDLQWVFVCVAGNIIL